MNMAHNRTPVLIVLIWTALTFSSCTTVAVKAWEDRSTVDQKIDTQIHTGILNRLTDKDKGLLLDVSLDVWEQRVMITGTLDDSAVHADVIKLAQQDDRIKAFYDHIQIVSKAEKDKRREQNEAQKEDEGGAVTDFWIETKIKAQLLTTQNVTSVNFFYRSVLNKVYVIGKAKSQFEKDLVLNVIKTTKGVSSVTEHINVSASS